MDYLQQQEIRVKVQAAEDTTARAEQIMEAVSRRHAELDQKLALLNARTAAIEAILKPELMAAQKKIITNDSSLPAAKPKGIFSRLIGKST